MKIERVNAEIKKQIALLIDKEIRDPRLEEAMISVTKVDTTRDLKYAKIYASVMQAEKPKEIIKVLQSSAGFLRKELFSRMNIRAVPELTFILDESAEYGFKIEQILKDLNNK